MKKIFFAGMLILVGVVIFKGFFGASSGSNVNSQSSATLTKSASNSSTSAVKSTANSAVQAQTATPKPAKSSRVS